MPFPATAVVTGLILLAIVVLYSLRMSGYIKKRSYSAAQRGIVVGLCLGLMFESTVGPVAGMAFGFIVGSLIDYAHRPKPISN